MKNFFVLITILIPIWIKAQTTEKNYEIVRTYKNATQFIESIIYIDGLARPMQTVRHKQGGNGQDIIQPIIYDINGRQSKSYLSYPSQSKVTLDYRENSTLINTLNNYYKVKYPSELSATDPNPYSETIYEESPFNRITASAFPGLSWKDVPNSDADHTIKYKYQTNNVGEVKKFMVSFPNSEREKPLLSVLSDYGSGELYKKITYNENWISGNGKNNTVEEFTDKKGKIILKRVYNEGNEHNTYYVYDIYSNLTYVIPPLASDNITERVGGRIQINQQIFNGLCYKYHYDKVNRLVEKYVPDSGWTHMVYDKQDRIILAQDENQRLTNAWIYTKYDSFNRESITGIYTDNRYRKEIQDYFDGQSFDLNVIRLSTPALSLENNVPIFYNEGTTFPSSSLTPYTYQYYDEYFSPTFTVGGVGYSIPLPNTVYGVALGSAKKLPVIRYTRILEGTNKNWIMNVVAYDNKARVIWNGNINSFLGTNERKEIKLDFTGEIIETTSKHTKNGVTMNIYDYYTYDHGNRLLTHSQKIGTGVKQLIAWNRYDALGKLDQKKVGGKVLSDDVLFPSAYASYSAYQTIAYTKNIRDWLTNINNVDSDLTLANNPLFTFRIDYTGLYNGNISQTMWKSGDNQLRKYEYTYDALNRLTNAFYSNMSFVFENYDEKGISYDKNGNILTLERFGSVGSNRFDKVDALNYTYKSMSNQLLKVTDTSIRTGKGFIGGTHTGDDYKYVAGNLTKDLNKGIGKTPSDEIVYNHLNLPKNVIIDPLHKIEYIYDAGGNKLQKKVTNGSGASSIKTTQYANGFIYQDNLLQYFSHPEGYIRKENDGNFTYIYQYKDHLGNIRLSYADTDGDGIIADTNFFSEGFEEGVGNWGGIGSNVQLELDNTIFRSGKYSAKITSPGPDGRYSKCGVWMDINNSQDTYYTYTVYIKSDRPNAEIVLFMKTAEETGFYTSIDSYAYHGYMTQWTKLEKTVLVPANIKKLSLRLDTNADGTVWFDDVSITRTNSITEIIEEDSYYPFGMKHEGNNISLSTNLGQKIKYNGKELQDELGLGWYDYQARNYDPVIGRWFNIDPLAEMSRRYSPYAYALDNPVYFIDTDGMFATPPDWYLDAKTGKVLGKDGASTNNVRVIYKSDWENTVATHGGSMSAQATSELQSMSGTVTINSAQIESNVNTINSETIADQSKERQVLIGLNVNESGNYPTAELTSVIGPEGPGGGEVQTAITNMYSNPEQTQLRSSRFEGTNLRPVAQVHTHNKATGKNEVNAPTTSPADRNSSMTQGITRYAVDSWTGDTEGGNQIHSVTSSGVQNNNVGTTQNFNIGQDALDKHIGN